MFTHYTDKHIEIFKSNTNKKLNGGVKPKHCLWFAKDKQWKNKWDEWMRTEPDADDYMPKPNIMYYVIDSFGSTKILNIIPEEDSPYIHYEFCGRVEYDWDKIKKDYDGVYILYKNNLVNKDKKMWLFNSVAVDSYAIWNPSKLVLSGPFLDI